MLESSRHAGVPATGHPVSLQTTLVVKQTAAPDILTVLPSAYMMWQGRVEDLLNRLADKPIFDFIISSPPYNIGKDYETRKELDLYLAHQEAVIDLLVPRLRDGGSLCWQVGTYVDNNQVWPLDIEFAPMFRRHGLQLRNRIVWHFGHGLHAQRRFSGRYEVILWYTKTKSPKDKYTFNLDTVRIPAKYPGKRHFKGPNHGEFSSNPLGKNPEDVWNIPNVKGNHVEKTGHPCQFPVGLVERLVLALTNPNDLVFDPYAGFAFAGVAAALHGRRFWGCEIVARYCRVGAKRINSALAGNAKYRPHDRPLFDHTRSSLSKAPRGYRTYPR